MKMPARLFLSPPHMGSDELALVKDAFESNYIAPLGPMVDAFEREFSAYTGLPHCVALCSGTAAMHLALRHLGEGGERGGQGRPIVIGATLTFIGSVTPACFEDCELRFVDADMTTWTMDPLLLEEELDACRREGRRVRAVVPTDLYGQCCGLLRIKTICDRFGVPVICDSAEAMGAKYLGSEVGGQRSEVGDPRSDVGGRKSGCLASEVGVRTSDAEESARPEPGIPDPYTRHPTPAPVWHHAGDDAWAAVYSFNGNKIITTSGGGMLASHDKSLIDHARKLSQQAREPAPWYEHTEIGYNYRMSNIVAAIGRGQLRVLDERVRRRREIFASYRSLLGDLPGLSFMPEADYNRATRWLTVVLVNAGEFGASPEEVRLALEAENIEARPVWKPMHKQPVFQHCRVRGGRVSEGLFRDGLCLPSGTAMTDEQIERVASIVRGVAARSGVV